MYDISQQKDSAKQIKIVRDAKIEIVQDKARHGAQGANFSRIEFVAQEELTR
jgi:hypothetical protein